MNKKINSLSSIIIRSFSIMNFITIHINDTIKYSVQYLASCTCLSADMLIYHICDILHHLPLSLMLPSLLQYPLRMVAPPSPPFSPEHHQSSHNCFGLFYIHWNNTTRTYQSSNPNNPLTKCSFHPQNVHRLDLHPSVSPCWNGQFLKQRLNFHDEKILDTEYGIM